MEVIQVLFIIFTTFKILNRNFKIIFPILGESFFLINITLYGVLIYFEYLSV